MSFHLAVVSDFPDLVFLLQFIIVYLRYLGSPLVISLLHNLPSPSYNTHYFGDRMQEYSYTAEQLFLFMD